jgi:hypothetical protein
LDIYLFPCFMPSKQNPWIWLDLCPMPDIDRLLLEPQIRVFLCVLQPNFVFFWVWPFKRRIIHLHLLHQTSLSPLTVKQFLLQPIQ